MFGDPYLHNTYKHEYEDISQEIYAIFKKLANKYIHIVSLLTEHDPFWLHI